MAFIPALFTALAPVVSTIAGAVGIATGIKSLTAGKQKESINDIQKNQPLPAVPTTEDAEKKAEIDLQKRRRISVLSGGNTDITRGQALVPDINIQKKSLLGA